MKHNGCYLCGAKPEILTSRTIGAIGAAADSVALCNECLKLDYSELRSKIIKLKAHKAEALRRVREGL